METEVATAVAVTANSKATVDTVALAVVATASKETAALEATAATEVLALEDNRVVDSAVPVALEVSEALQVAEEVDRCVVVEEVAAEPADLPRTKIIATRPL